MSANISNNGLDKGFKILNELVSTLNWILTHDVSLFNYNKLLKKFGTIIGANRSYIYFKKNNKYKISGEWSDEVYCMSKKEHELDQKKLPILSKVSDGLLINTLIKDIDEKSKRVLSREKIKSILILPIFCMNNQIKGFVGFDDCENETLWGEMEILALNSLSVVVGNIVTISEKNEIRNQEIKTHVSYLKDIQRSIEKTSKRIRGNLYARA
jgi:hypothetical protein